MAARYATKITPAVADALRDAHVDGNTLTLQGQLDRATYVAVNKVIELIGGSWDRRRKCHVFPADAAATIADALRDTVEKVVAAGEIIDVRKVRQAFFTPPEVASLLVDHADLSASHRILEPSAGHGALIAAAVEIVGETRIDAVEIDAESCGVLRARFPLVKVIPGDFLGFDHPVLERQYDRIIMNPPFSNNQDIKHLEHALKYLSNHGVLVAVLPSGWHRRVKPKTDLFEEYRITVVEHLDAGAFKSSGTNIATDIVTFYR